MQVDAGSTLGGGGTVGDVDITGGSLSPGDGKGALNIGSLTMDTNSTFVAQLAGPGTTAFGQVDPSGGVILGGTLAAALTGGYTPNVGDQLTIVRNGSGTSVSGTFSGLAEGSTDVIDGYPFKITYKGGSGDDVILTALPFPTITTISASTSSATYGQSVTFTAAVSGGQTGTQGLSNGEVTFYDGNPAIGSTQLDIAAVNGQGQATYTTSKLDVTGSPHEIYAVYDPAPSSDLGSSITMMPASLTITPLTITGSLTGTVTKTYDGTTTATLSAGNYELSGVKNGDDVSLDGPTAGTYDTSQVGTGKTVSVIGLSLTGTGAANYVLGNDSVSGPVGVIVAKSLVVTGITAEDKIYDGTTSAKINTGAAGLSGVIGGDEVGLVASGAVGSFSDNNAGIDKSVLVGGLLLTGADASDYTITSPILATATINPAPLTVTANPATMTYGGTVPALTDSTSGLIGRRHAGLGPLRLAGDDGDIEVPGRQLSDHSGDADRRQRQLHHHFRRCKPLGDSGSLDDHGQRCIEGLRRGTPGPDGRLQRVCQRRHGRKIDHVPEPDDVRHGRQSGGYLRDQCGGRRVERLYDHVYARHAHRDSGR